MMTTKIFQRVLAIFLVVTAIFLNSSIVNARTLTGFTINGREVDIPDELLIDSGDSVNLYDYNIENMMNGIRELIKDYNIQIRGTHYYTGTDGFMYCESSFGENNTHGLIFKLKNDGSVLSALIITPIFNLSGKNNDSGSYNSGVLAGSIWAMAGMSAKQIVDLSSELGTWIDAYSRVCW